MKRLPLFSLILLQASLSTAQEHADQKCPVQNIEKDYENIYGHTDEKTAFMLKKIVLNPLIPPALFVANELSCGSQGCEYAIYQPLSKSCFKRIGSFVGHFTLLNSSHFGLRDFKVGGKLYAFNSIQKAYVEKSK